MNARAGWWRWSGAFPIAAGFAMTACVVYCAVWWEPHPMGWGDVDCSWGCWMFCATLAPGWGTLALAVALANAAAGTGVLLGRKGAAGWAALAGLAALPAGALSLVPWLLARAGRKSLAQ